MNDVGISFRANVSSLRTDPGGGAKIILHIFPDDFEAVKNLLGLHLKNVQVAVIPIPEETNFP